MFVPNDTACLKTWYTPTHLYNQMLSFLVAEKGVFLLDNHTFVVATGLINRTTNNLLNRSNWFYYSHPRGCNGNYAVPCSYPTSLPTTQIGAIATIQTLVFNTYLLLRVHTTQRTRIGMILTPHDSLQPSYFSSFNKYETVGYVTFETGFALTCIEGVQFETASFSPITSTFFQFVYKNTYSQPPYAFGMLVTQASLTDSTAIRVFNRTKTRARAITQEDQCASEQVVHTTPERATMFIFSLIPPGSGIYCFSNDDPTSVPTRAPTRMPTSTPTSVPTHLPTSSPTVAPTTSPTDFPTFEPSGSNIKCYNFVAWDIFGDGWTNQVLEVEHLTNPAKTATYDLNCKCRNIRYCFDHISNANANISIITEDPSKDVRHGWESHFTFVDDNGVTYVGNQHSTLQMWHGNVTCFNCVDYSLNNTDNQCDRCKHPPPKPPPTPPKNSGGGPDKPKTNNTRHLSETGDRMLAIMEVDEMAATAFVVTGNSSGGGRPGGSSPKPKRPPLNFPFVLIDETTSSRGWYDGTGDTMDMCGLPTPTVLTYPKYYISNADRTKLIHSGTICGPHSPEKCQEVLPYDGKFVWRVGGYDANPDDIQWHFCTVDGGLGQELSFTMKNGKCIPGDMIDADDYCNGVVTLAMFVGELRVSVQSAEEELSVAETRTLETKLSKDLFLNSKVAINSYVKEASDESFLMRFTVTVRVEDVSNYVGTVEGQLDDFAEVFVSAASQSVLSGTFSASLQAAVMSDPTLMSTQLSAVTSMEMVSLELSSYDFEVQDRILDRPVVEEEVSEEIISGKQSISIVGYASVAVGLAVLVAVVFVVVVNRRVAGPSYGPVARSASQHGSAMTPNKMESGYNMDCSNASLVDDSTRSSVGMSMRADDEVFRFSKKYRA